MPTYEYACKSCGEHLEVFQSFQEKPLKKHDECGGELQKRFHASGIVFKGSGFYATDSKSSSSAKPSSTDGSKKKESSDSKPKAEASTSASSEG
jgi:putative FmdB family regulatory protein